MKGNRVSPKKTQIISPNNTKKATSPSKLKTKSQVVKQPAKIVEQSRNKKQKGGCGAGCNLF